MKRIVAIASMLFLSISFGITEAQAKISIRINIGSQPGWGPTGYDYAQYYYFPDYDFYYDIERAKYIIFRNNAWTYVSTVPATYRFDPYNAYKVVVNQNKPYLYNKTHRATYAQYKGKARQQVMIRDSRDYKYYASKGHPNHNKWNGNNNQSNNNHPTQANNRVNNNRTPSGQTEYASRNDRQNNNKPNQQQTWVNNQRNNNSR